MTNKKRWSQEEDRVLLNQVKRSPTNLKHAFVRTSEILEGERTPHSCAQRWYSHVSKDPRNTCFITVSSKHKSPNRKNGEGEPCTPSIFTRILRILGINV